MLVAPKPAAGPEWLTVGTARVLFAPIDRIAMRRARKVALKAVAPEGGEATDFEDLGDELSHALIVGGARDWQDVVTIGDDGTASAMSFSPENLALLLSDPVIFDMFDAAYVLPYATRERAKNVPAGSPNTTGAMATPAKTTAASPAEAKPGASNARTANTSSRTRKSRKPSTS